MKTRVVQMSDREFKALSGLIRGRTGIAYQEGKRYVLESRLSARLEALGLNDFEQYARYLAAAPQREEEFQELLSRVTVNDGCFLRHPAQFESIEREVLGTLLAARSGVRRLRMWSAGCGTGEEAYTLAILVAGLLGDQLPAWDIEVLGTDVCESALRQARSGLYGVSSFRSAPAAWAADRFIEIEGWRQVVSEVRSMVRFEPHSLLDPLSARRLGAWDVILCRDTLIHLDPSSRNIAAGTLHGQLAEDGLLVLGPSETLGGVDAGFSSVRCGSVQAYAKRAMEVACAA